ncbi:MAG: methyltransferase domain-containing protein [Chloroflexota bacterium]
MLTNASKPLDSLPGTPAGDHALHYHLHNDPQSSHQQIYQLVQRIGQGPILDVGAAQGFLGQMLLESQLPIDAIEPHAAWATHAALYYRTMYHSDIDSVELPEELYRVVVCADVLEHTVDPVKALCKLQKAAHPDALYIISLPNVAHIAARLLLLSGRFPKMERGIFDRTHLHFYTQQTALDMLQNAGLEAIRIRPTPVPLEQIWNPKYGKLGLRALMFFQRMCLLLAPTLFAFQWIIVARTAHSETPLL